MLLPIAAVSVALCAAACGGNGSAYPGTGGSMVVVLSGTATRAQADAVVATCGKLPGADGALVLMDDRQPGELRLRLEDDVTGVEERKIRDCLAASPGVDVERSEGFPVPL